MPLSQEILYTQLFGATTWRVPRSVSLSVGLPTILSSDGDRCITFLNNSRASGAGRYDLNCESVFAAGEFARCQCSASEKVGTSKSRTSADQKKRESNGKHHVQCIPGYTYGLFLTASTFGSFGLWEIHVSQRQPPGL